MTVTNKLVVNNPFKNDNDIAIEVQDNTMTGFKTDVFTKGTIEIKYFTRGGSRFFFYDSKTDKIIYNSWTEYSYTEDFDCVPGKQCYIDGAMNCIQGKVSGNVTLTLTITDSSITFNFESDAGKTFNYELKNDSDNYENYVEGTKLTDFIKEFDHIFVFPINREDTTEPIYIKSIKYNNNSQIKPEYTFNGLLTYNIIDAYDIASFKELLKFYSCRNIENPLEISNLNFVQKKQVCFDFTCKNNVVSYICHSMDKNGNPLTEEFTNYMNCIKITLNFREDVLTDENTIKNSNPNIKEVIKNIDSLNKLTITFNNKLEYNTDSTVLFSLPDEIENLQLQNKGVELNDFEYVDYNNNNKPFGYVPIPSIDTKNLILLSAGCD